MRGARTKLFHAIVGLGLASGVACSSSVENAAAGSSGGTGGNGGNSGNSSSTHSTASSTGSQMTASSSGGLGGSGGAMNDAGQSDAPNDAQQNWDVITIK